MDYLDTLKKAKKPTTYNWQQKALDMWRYLKLDTKPTSSYFLCFKRNPKKAEQIILSMSDGQFKNPLTTFFWKYNNG